jgi:hypothetical protein
MIVGRHRKSKPPGRRQLVLRVAGAALLAVSASIHLALYLTGYRSIPTIGWLFLLQVIVGFVLVAGALVTYSRLAAAAGAAFALSTLGCYLLAVWTGLFGQGGPDEGGNRRRADRGGRLRDAGPGRAGHRGRTPGH